MKDNCKESVPSVYNISRDSSSSPLLSSLLNSGKNASTLGYLEFFKDGNLVLKLDAKQESEKGCYWTESAEKRRRSVKFTGQLAIDDCIQPKCSPSPGCISLSCTDSNDSPPSSIASSNSTSSSSNRSNRRKKLTKLYEPNTLAEQSKEDEESPSPSASTTPTPILTKNVHSTATKKLEPTKSFHSSTTINRRNRHHYINHNHHSPQVSRPGSSQDSPFQQQQQQQQQQIMYHTPDSPVSLTSKNTSPSPSSPRSTQTLDDFGPQIDWFGVSLELYRNLYEYQRSLFLNSFVPR